jgi:hypothetical protein
VAVSNPSFELWLILHHRDQNAYLTTDAAGDLSEKLGGQREKDIDFSVYEPLRHQAAARARRLVAKHAGDGTAFPQDNPSSGMYLFLEAIGDVEEPTKATP